jgi:hypothetical protein
MISEISTLPCKDLVGLIVPTALCYVLCLTSLADSNPTLSAITFFV